MLKVRFTKEEIEELEGIANNSSDRLAGGLSRIFLLALDHDARIEALERRAIPVGSGESRNMPDYPFWVRSDGGKENV